MYFSAVLVTLWVYFHEFWSHTSYVYSECTRILRHKPTPNTCPTKSCYNYALVDPSGQISHTHIFLVSSRCCDTYPLSMQCSRLHRYSCMSNEAWSLQSDCIMNTLAKTSLPHTGRGSKVTVQPEWPHSHSLPWCTPAGSLVAACS